MMMIEGGRRECGICEAEEYEEDDDEEEEEEKEEEDDNDDDDADVKENSRHPYSSYVAHPLHESLPYLMQF
ncbi:Hypothetical predicted protein [Octopus vulgaris]|uniref:Uncharacterized protein n=1 Tax=Octopus vulgaris TaxID=6645 RepID=A0AA36B3Z5_OCTVU|nr:Hypothetical predicted protein [Octopus vulgaris]